MVRDIPTQWASNSLSEPPDCVGTLASPQLHLARGLGALAPRLRDHACHLGALEHLGGMVAWTRGLRAGRVRGFCANTLWLRTESCCSRLIWPNVFSGGLQEILVNLGSQSRPKLHFLVTAWLGSCACTFANACAHVHVCIYIYIQKTTHMCMCVYVYVSKPRANLTIYMYTYIFMYAGSRMQKMSKGNMNDPQRVHVQGATRINTQLDTASERVSKYRNK